MSLAAPFARLESRLNAAVLSRLSNVVAQLNGAPVAGVFDNGYALGAVGQSGMASGQPVLTCATPLFDPVGATVGIGQDSYLVVAHEPDGTGMSRLILEVQ